MRVIAAGMRRAARYRGFEKARETGPWESERCES